MKVKKAEFSKLARNKNDFPPERYPEIVLVGRSNVGKSSLINTLIGRKNLARTSNTPGKTRGIHFYLIDDIFYFVDLPGYGYAKVSRQLQREWASLIEEYLSCRKTIVLIFLVVDSRHEPSQEDIEMAAWLRHFSFKAQIVAAKADKVPRGKWERQRQIIARTLEVDPRTIIFFSARTGQGRDNLTTFVKGLVSRGRGC